MSAGRRAHRRRDFTLADHGSVVLLQPISSKAEAWLDRHVGQGDDVQWFAGAVVVEPRYVADIVAGIQVDGLRVVLS